MDINSVYWKRFNYESKYLVKPNVDIIVSAIDSHSKWFMDHTDELNSLNSEIFDYYKRNRQSDDEFKRKMAFKDNVKNVVKKYRDWWFDVFPSGSTLTFLGTRNCDLDLCIWCPEANNAFETERDAAYNILRILRHIFYFDEKFKKDIVDIEYVDATIPILKIRTIDGLEVDLSSCTENFVSGLHNSFLIRSFAIADERFAPLCVLVKQWATVTGVKNPKDGCFNSYALVMLVIHFLQCGVSPPILPNLQKLFPDQYATDKDNFPQVVDFDAHCFPEELPEIDYNITSVAELFILFLDYYISFDFSSNYISMRDACVQSKALDSDNKYERNEVYIKDPIDDHNPGRTVKDIGKIKFEMRVTLGMFKQGIPVQGHNENSRRFPQLVDILPFLLSSK